MAALEVECSCQLQSAGGGAGCANDLDDLQQTELLTGIYRPLQ